MNSCDVYVFDLFGKLLLNEKNSAALDLSAFDNGIYLVTISAKSGSTTKRVTLIK